MSTKKEPTGDKLKETLELVQGCLSMASKPEMKSLRQYLRRKTTEYITKYIQQLDKDEVDPNQLKADI